MQMQFPPQQYHVDYPPPQQQYPIDFPSFQQQQPYPIEFPRTMHVVRRPRSRQRLDIPTTLPINLRPTIYKRRLKQPNDHSYLRRPTRSQSYVQSRSLITSGSFNSSRSSYLPSYNRSRTPSPPPRTRKVRKVTVYVPKSRSRSRSGSPSSSVSPVPTTASTEFITKCVVHRSQSYSIKDRESNDHYRRE
jgi:hypothetical protein